MDNKKRRSSILKPQKPKARNPLRDLDMRNDEEIEDTAVIRARRVSFASSNQVKKFTAVAERNTIWDSTYEESVEGSDNSPFSLHLHTTESCTINKENVDIAANLDATTIQDMSLDDLDLTPTVDCITSTKVQESIIKHLSETQYTHKDQVRFKEHEVNSVEITKVINKENIRIKTTEHQTFICDKTVEFTEVNRVNLMEEDMEVSCMTDMTFTAAVPAAIHQNRTKLMSADMDLTQVAPQNVYQSICASDSSMDLTRPLQSQIVTHQIQDMSLDESLPVHANIQGKSNDQTLEMDFTKPLNTNMLKFDAERLHIIQGIDHERNATVKMEEIDKSVDMEFTKPVNFSVNQNNDMEFTKVVDVNIMGKPVEENVDVNYELEFTKPVESEFLKGVTCAVAPQAIEKFMVNNCLTPHDNMNLTNTNFEMEFTRAVDGNIMGKPVEETVDVNYELEFTKPVESEFLKSVTCADAPQAIEKCMVNNCLTPHDNMNLTNTNFEMEFTRAVDGNIMGKPVEENVDVNYELEFTKPVESEFLKGVVCAVDPQTNEKCMVNDCLAPTDNMNLTNTNFEMEFTRAVDGNIMGKPVEENVDVNYELEFTKPVESEFLKGVACAVDPQTNEKCMVNDCLAPTDNMNLTNTNFEMEFTRAVDGNIMGKPVEENVDVNYELEFTKPVESEFLKGVTCAAAPQTIEKCMVNDCLTPTDNMNLTNTNFEMEFTKAVGNIMGKPVEENVDVNYELEFTKPVEIEFLKGVTCVDAPQTIEESMVVDCVTRHSNINLTNANNEIEFTTIVGGNVKGTSVKENIDKHFELDCTKLAESMTFQTGGKNIENAKLLKRAACVDAPQTIENSVVVDCQTENNESISKVLPETLNKNSEMSSNKTDELIMKNIPSTSKDKSKIDKTQVLPKCLDTYSKKNIDIEKRKDNISSNFTYGTEKILNKSLEKISKQIPEPTVTVEESFKSLSRTQPNFVSETIKPSTTVLDKMPITTDDLITIEKSLNRTSITQSASTSCDKSNFLLETTKPSIIILDKTDMSMDINIAHINTQPDVLKQTQQNNILKMPEPHQLQSSLRQINPSENKHQPKTNPSTVINNDLAKKQSSTKTTSSELSRTSKTIQSENLTLTPDCSLLRKRSSIPLKHPSETTLTPVLFSKKNCVQKNLKMPNTTPKKCMKDQSSLKPTPLELSQTSKTVESDNLTVTATNATVTPDCSLLGKRLSIPLKHPSETTLTPVVSSKRKRIGKNLKIPIVVNTNAATPKKSAQTELCTDGERSLPTIDETGMKTVEDQSLHCMTFNSSTYDDTNQLINYNVSGKCKSDFSKIAMGENTSFPKLAYMPLGEFNSNSFHVSLNVTHPPEDKNNDDVIVDASMNKVNEEEAEFSHSDILDNTRPPEFLHDMTNSSCDSVFLPEHNPAPKPLLDKILSGIGLKREDLGPFADIPLPASLSLIYEEVKFEKIDLAKAKRRCDKTCALYRAAREKMERELEELRNSMSNFDITFTDSSNSEMTGDGDTDDSLSRNLVIEEVIEKTTLDKINDLIKRNENQKKYWFLLSSVGNTYKFSTFYKTIIFTVHLNEDFVTHIELENPNMKNRKHPEGRYAHKIFMEKLALQSLQKSLGEKFDIFSLLDYVQMTMLKQVELMTELEDLFKTYGTILHDDFKLKFSVIRVKLKFVWKFSIDMLELEPVNDKTVTYFAKVGTPRNEEINQCRTGCPNGVPFVRKFIQNIIAMVEKKKNQSDFFYKNKYEDLKNNYILHRLNEHA